MTDLYMISPRQKNTKNGSFFSISREHIAPLQSEGPHDIAKNFDSYLYE
jgi:hypothetical protein